ncbi:serine/threonine protein kinase YCK1 KNAG_0H03710 [Huiozyma naganishii CBS 8797]|uniref:non-specific serine/threonine protein kinase n=1 Tax=Huiozyma naganishii (strain ATCC MYA-139 / BCRC 22969 / CBS 8797 / KCTC 17520 / NBRC 10181 / NCYC 3082 / Yp74L-3) TaxID=1071383 RepID=J7RA83_HUIN7|nr:hypothetical protein KNAG_0H03710 [Kazachstania naganishii CBS 8797]CCK71785.1 hypothetical protein KNAG_0H03710 [Kazachstania naganishii CBS 8797]
MMANGNTALAVSQLTNVQYNSRPASNMMGQASTSSRADNDANVVGLHYKIGKKIGEGSFGVLFEGVNMINGVSVAIKFEPRKTEAPQLKDEYRTYKIMAGTPGIPLAYYFGQEGLHNILVIDLLGPSLEDLFDWCGRKFTPKTVVQIAVQMITFLEELHNHDLIYRDIKPDNFLIGRPGQPDENNIHMIDFGMAKQYRDPKTKQHIPYREKKSLSGTARYMSINTHLGREQSRRDDMEAMGHVFFYFLRGSLPWQGLKAPNNKQKYEKIGEKKRTTNVYDLAQGYPIQFGRYLEIVRNLGFDETPDYEGYRQLMLSVLDDSHETADGKYDWMKLNGGHGYDLSINKKPNLHGYGHPTPPNEKSRRHKHGKIGNQLPQLPQQVPQPMSQQQQQNLQAQQRAQQQFGQKMPQKAGMVNGGNYNNFDPNSYESFQQQSQQRFSQQQLHQQQYQQKIMMQGQKNYSPQVAAANGSPVNNGTGGYQRQQDPMVQGQGGMQSSAQPLQSAGHANPSSTAHQQQQQPIATNQASESSVEEHKGFFAKLGCC